MEAEYIAQALCAREAAWILKLQNDFGVETNAILIHADNTGAIELARDHKSTIKSKHIDVVYHLTRDYVQRGLIKITYIPTKDMIADCMTKPFGKVKLEEFTSAMGLQGRVKTEGAC